MRKINGKYIIHNGSILFSAYSPANRMLITAKYAENNGLPLIFTIYPEGKNQMISNNIVRIIPLLAFLLGTWYFCIRILGYHLEFIPGDLGDARFINYLLEHSHQWICGDVKSFWNAGFMYPFENSIAISDSMLGTAPVYSLWRIFGFSPETSYQLWWISICALNYWCSYIIFKKWFGRKDLAVVLAWIFAFTVFNLGQINYMQMIIRFMVPVVFYAAYKLIETPSVKYVAIYSLGIVFQFYCAMYTGFYLLYFSLLFIILYLVLGNKWKNLLYYFRKQNILFFLLALAAAFSAFLPLMFPYLEMSKLLGLKTYEEVIMHVPLWESYLFIHESYITWNFMYTVFLPNTEFWWLHHLFTGIIPFLTMILSPLYFFYCWLKKKNINRVLAALIITSTIIVIFHFRTENNASLYWMIFKLPGMGSMRVLIRFMHVEIFIILLIAGYMFMKLQPKYVLVLFMIIFIDNLFRPELLARQQKADLIQRKENLITEIKKHDYSEYRAIVLIDTVQPPYISHIDMMLASQQLKMPTVNGYSSNCKPEFGYFFLEDSESGLEHWLNYSNVSKEEILIIRR
jgi:hypothetical protein